MDVFISWSGERSRAAAEALRNWLPKIINAIKPWLSVADIEKGARWSTDVATRLKDAKAGIVCLTPNNLHSEWILFETGALSKTLENTFVCPLLVGLDPSDLKGPMAQFQATRATKNDILKLLKTLNTALSEGALPEIHIEEAFEVWWPKLESQLKALPPEESKTETHRPDRDLLEEILALVRSQSRASETLLQGPSFARGTVSQAAWESTIHKEIKKSFEADGESAVMITSAPTLISDSEAYVVKTSSGGSVRLILPTKGPLNKVLEEIRNQIKIYLEGVALHYSPSPRDIE